MSLEDFLKYFNIVFASNSFDESWDKYTIADSWSTGRSGGSVFNLENARFNPQYQLRFAEPTEAFFQLHQIAPHTKAGSCNLFNLLEIPMIGFEIYKNFGMPIGDPESKEVELIGKSMYLSERNVTLEIGLGEGSYILLITTYYPDIWEDFTLTIWTRKNSTGEKLLEIKKIN